MKNYRNKNGCHNCKFLYNDDDSLFCTQKYPMKKRPVKTDRASREKHYAQTYKALIDNREVQRYGICDDWTSGTIRQKSL